MKIKIIVTILLFSINTAIGQKIKGKWAMIIPLNTYLSPDCPVIEIKENKLITYSFNKVEYDEPVIVDYKKKILRLGKENQTNSEFEFINNYTIRLYQKSKNGKEQYFDYVKLFPTIMNFTIEEVRNKQYEHFFSKSFIQQKDFIKFKGTMCSEYTEKIIGIDRCDRFRIEKIDHTYFIVYYSSSKKVKNYMIPIKEINKDHIIVYGVFEKDGFMKLKEIKEIVPKQDFFLKN